MSLKPSCILNACSECAIPLNTPVWNRCRVEYYVWVKIPTCATRDFELYEIEELVKPKKELDVKAYCIYDSVHPWYRFMSIGLNLDIGLHIYRMHLINRFTDDVISLFFSYRIQEDDPDCEYIYMDHEDGVCKCNG